MGIWRLSRIRCFGGWVCLFSTPVSTPRRDQTWPSPPCETDDLRCGDVCNTGRWNHLVTVGFWNGQKLAREHPILEGTKKWTTLVRLYSVIQVRSAEPKSLLRAAAKWDVREAVQTR